MTPFDTLAKKPFENIVGKGEIACISIFSFSQNTFDSIKDKNDHFCYICPLQKRFQFGLVQDFVMCHSGNRSTQDSHCFQYHVLTKTIDLM